MTWSAGADRFTLTGPEGLVCFTTTRARAIPAGGAEPADLRAAVEGGSSRPRAVIGMEQVHGGRITRVRAPFAAVLPGCDGLVTDQPGVALIVRTADCLPIVAWDPSRKVLGVAHAGWRGLRAGIARELVGAIGAGDLQAAIGPGIGPCCYEVGPEFAGWAGGHLQRRDGRLFMDLAGMAAAQLREAGVGAGRIARAPWCSFCDRERCCSYRREGAGAGRMVTCAMVVE